MITKKQKAVLDFITKYQSKKTYAPSLEEIKKRFRLASVSTAHFHVKKLEGLGYLKKEYNKPRSIHIYENPKSMWGVLADAPPATAYGIERELLPLQKKISPTTVRRERPLPLNRIILIDAIDALRKIPDNSCDVVIADPPYNIGKDFGNNLDKRELGDYIVWCRQWIAECIRTMKPTGTMFIYGFSEILAHLSVEIPINKRWLIWHYTNKNVASLNFWQRSHESIICAWKDRPIFNRDDVREPYTTGFLNGAAGKVRKGTLGRFSRSGIETVYKAHEGGALPRDVIKIPALAGGAGMIERWFLCKTCDGVFEPRQLPRHNGHEVMKHPTQKPLELSRKLIRSAMPRKNGVVLVPFVGTGSECVAAKELGQSYIGFEINPDYVKLAEKAINKTRIASSLF